MMNFPFTWTVYSNIQEIGNTHSFTEDFLSVDGALKYFLKYKTYGVTVHFNNYGSAEG